MGTESVNLGEPDRPPVWANWYGGRRREDGADPRRLSLTTNGSDGCLEHLTLSIPEVKSLLDYLHHHPHSGFMRELAGVDLQQMNQQALQEFETKWWQDARAAAREAQERGQESFPAICPDGTVRDLLCNDAEMPT